MSTILFYTPFDRRSRDTETLMIAFRQQGHRVMFLSQETGFQIGPFLESRGIEVFTHVLSDRRPGWWYYLRHIFFFVKFCRKHKIDIVYSHLEPANLVASVGQYFIRAQTYLCRHHINEAALSGFAKSLYYRMTYFLARKIIVVSHEALQYMVEYEHIPRYKILHINLAYDFTLYKEPDPLSVKKIREESDAQILLVTAGRLVEGKRPQIAIQIVQMLRSQGYNAKLFVLGTGPMESSLHKLVEEEVLANCIFQPGYVDNILEYMEAADFLIHPSLMESSCVVIKEAGLAKLPVIVCRGVGDFDSYLVHGENGFLIGPDNFSAEAAEIITKNFSRKEILTTMGNKLRKTILEKFGIEAVIGQYDSLNKS